jgi:hypothetical protein
MNFTLSKRKKTKKVKSQLDYYTEGKFVSKYPLHHIIVGHQVTVKANKKMEFLRGT